MNKIIEIHENSLRDGMHPKRHQITADEMVAVATALGLYALGFQVWVSGLCFALCAFVCGTIGQEFVRGALVRREATGTDLFTVFDNPYDTTPGLDQRNRSILVKLSYLLNL